MPEITALHLAVGALVTAVLVVVGLHGWSRERQRAARLAAECDAAQARLARLENQAKEANRRLARSREEGNSVASLAMSLPGVVQQLNRDDLPYDKIPALIFNLARSIFAPGQMLFYLARPSKTKRGDYELVLRQQEGLSGIHDALKCIPFGEGKIGWVAQNRLERVPDDWRALTRSDGVTVTDNHPAMSLDLLGPLVHHTFQGEQVLGVLCIGKLETRPKNEKLLLQMVTNLGSLALVNATNVKRLREQANHDGLTQLLNKRYFMHCLAELTLEHSSKAKPLSVFIFDIDHFKNYNDTNGHVAGDQLLRGLAALLRETIRPGDWCCRYGGEEFMVAMPHTAGEEAMVQAERIRAAIDAYKFEHQQKQPSGNLTISGGVAVFPKDGNSIEELTTHADEALYQSKHGGRNRVGRYRGVEIGEMGNPDEIGGFRELSNETQIELTPVPDGER